MKHLKKYNDLLITKMCEELTIDELGKLHDNDKDNDKDFRLTKDEISILNLIYDAVLRDTEFIEDIKSKYTIPKKIDDYKKYKKEFLIDIITHYLSIMEVKHNYKDKEEEMVYKSLIEYARDILNKIIGVYKPYEDEYYLNTVELTDDEKIFLIEIYNKFVKYDSFKERVKEYFNVDIRPIHYIPDVDTLYKEVVLDVLDMSYNLGKKQKKPKIPKEFFTMIEKIVNKIKDSIYY